MSRRTLYTGMRELRVLSDHDPDHRCRPSGDAKRMRPRGRGTIVQVGSALAYRGVPLQSAYCAAKFAIRGFTESLRVELRRERSPINLTMVQLAAFDFLGARAPETVKGARSRPRSLPRRAMAGPLLDLMRGARTRGRSLKIECRR
jgi:NAD(P)-dependent dehydrogenase (short-subunit alcohol dehydrogenase family)